MIQARILSRMGLALALTLTVAGRASADIATYDLTVSNLGGGFTGPFVEVQVNRTDSTHATITFTSLTNGGFEYLMHANGAAAVNVNASTWTIGSISASFQGNPLTAPTNGGAGQEDGFGNFNQTVNMTDGNPAQGTAADHISFVLTDTGGTWGSASSVLTPNAGGGNGGPSVAGAQIGAWDQVAGHGFTATGFAGVAVLRPPPGVPEPSTLALAVLGAVGFLGYGLRRRLKT
jgi:hypothetical protein